MDKQLVKFVARITTSIFGFILAADLLYLRFSGFWVELNWFTDTTEIIFLVTFALWCLGITVWEILQVYKEKDNETST